MQQQPNMLIAFFQEVFQRFKTKSPKFFRIWQLITGLGAAITGIPATLQQFGVVIPPPYDVTANKVIAAVSTGMFIMSALTTQSTIVAGKDGEPPLKQTQDNLKFTAATEINNTTKELAGK